MSEKFLSAPGKVVSITDLVVPKARDLAYLLRSDGSDYAKLLECRSCDGGELVVFDVEVELGQRRIHQIERLERIAVKYYSSDEQMPEILALRKDFPQVSHLNLREKELPRSLCLYDQSYRELKRNWTAPQLVERIRWWLKLTAKGKLHSDDQPLEPLLWGHDGHIVLPSDILDHDNEKAIVKQLKITRIPSGDYFFIAEYEADESAKESVPQNEKSCVACLLCCAPQQHGIIRYKPTNLEELSRFTEQSGLDLLEAIRKYIKSTEAYQERVNYPRVAFLESRLILLIALPKTREIHGPIENNELWAFATGKTVRDIGIAIGLWTENEGNLGVELTPPDDRTGKEVGLDLLDPHFRLTHQKASIINGLSGEGLDAKIACVGAGALGSQMILNLARAGFGIWTIIDHDHLLPHNLTRHALPGRAVGFPKAPCVANFANTFSDDSPKRFSSITADILDAGDCAQGISETFDNAHVILDASASVSVARYLTHEVDATAKRVSVFLNPTGKDLVLLAEDKERLFPLDSLEMQYYRAIVNDNRLNGHFEPAGNQPRYGQSCRDITSRIPQDSMALHAAIASRAVRATIASDDPSITIWRADNELAVQVLHVHPATVIHFRRGDWDVQIDSEVLSRLHENRTKKLPNETGGILIGSVDLERQVVYIIDALPSPADSQEWPTLYIRGACGLKSRVKQIHEASNGMLHYLGEWHSHPPGCVTAPSEDDLKVFEWLTEKMALDGFPALMLIVGDVGQVSSFLGTIEPCENLIPTDDCNV